VSNREEKKNFRSNQTQLNSDATIESAKICQSAVKKIAQKFGIEQQGVRK
jgi:hypothetical protein